MAEPSTNRSPTSREQAMPELPPIMGRGGPPGMRMMGKVEHAKDKRGTIRRLWGYLRRQKLALISTGLIVAVNTVLTLLGPYLMGRAIDQYILPGDLPGLLRISGLM